MHIEPLHDVVILRPHKEVLSKGGIMIPRESEFHEDVGTVVFCGPGQLNDDGLLLPMFVKPGDRVMFSTHGHQVTTIEGEELIVLRQNSIIGIFREEKVQLKVASA